MNHTIGKLIRTLQSELYFMKEAKDAFYYHSRQLLRRPHDPDYRAVSFIPDSLPGCYLDVGANQGQSIESLRLYKPSARIYSYEANSSLAKKLMNRYAHHNDITILPYGLTDRKQERILFTPVYKGFVYDGIASFDKDSAANWLNANTLYWFSPESLELRETPCSTERLDDQALDPIFIKIDVQGYEYQVVEGGIETIRRCEPVLMIEDLYPSLVHLLHELGYEQYLFDETGFYRCDSLQVINTLLMTTDRAGTVTRSAKG